MKELKKENIIMYQRQARPVPEKHSQEYGFLLTAIRNANTFILPEYFTFHPQIKDQKQLLENSQQTLDFLLTFSSQKESADTLLIGGTIIVNENQRYYNACPIIYNGSLLNYYFKRNLFLKESELLTPGSNPMTIQNPLTKDTWGIMICADVQNPDFFLAYKGLNYLAIPVASPYRPDDTAKMQTERDHSIFLNGAQNTGAVVFKCCLVGATGHIGNDQTMHRVQGRSLIATPQGIIARAPSIDWQGLIKYSVESKKVALEEFCPND